MMDINSLPSDDEEYDIIDEFSANWSPENLPIDNEECSKFSKENVSVLNCGLPTSEHQAVLTTHFGHTEFRPLQWKIISSIVNDCRDVCAVIATGYGKSLCYQYPPVYKDGLAIIISPLISLMEDQVLSLEMSNIPACFLGSAQSKSKTIIKEIVQGKYKVVYATPEYITGECGMVDLHQISESNNITLLAVDEAHCVSQWGHDFRPKYRNLWKVRNILPNVPILAVTATATSMVEEDIIKSLQLRNPLVVSSSFDRPNLYFEAKLKSDEPYSDIKKCMNRTSNDRVKFGGSTIIYCLTQKSTETIHKNLSSHGIKCVMYHAGINIQERRKAHEEFVKDKVKCVVATIAFGMGIDKPDVRNVIHYGASKDLEGYYQEVGRAGRDGLPARCTVFFSNADFTIHQNLRERMTSNSYKQHLQNNTNIMEKYLNSTECRRKFILRYFNDKICSWKDLKPRKNCCDNCSNILEAPAVSLQYEGIDENGMYNMIVDGKLFLQAVNALNGKFGLVKYCKLLTGSKSSGVPPQFKNMSIFGKGSYKSEEWWKIIGRILRTEDYLSENVSKKGKLNYSTLSLSSKGSMILYDKNPNLELNINPTLNMKKLMKKIMVTPLSSSKEQTTSKEQSSWINERTTVAQSNTSTVDVNIEKPEERAFRMELFKILLNTRNDLAYKANCSPYMVASNTALMTMSKICPKSIQEFKLFNIDGMTEGKINKFGQKFVEIISKFCLTKSVEMNLTPNNIETLDKPPKKTGISQLKQFAFVENKIPENSELLFKDEDDMSEISDAALSQIYDNLDESYTNIKANEFGKNEISTNMSHNCNVEENSDLFEDNWLNSPKAESTTAEENNSLDTFDKEDMNISGNNETLEERKQGVKNKRQSNNWCASKKHFSNKYLDF